MYHSETGVLADERLHSKVPLVSLLGLVHLRVMPAILALGRTRCRNQDDSYHRVLPAHQAFVGECDVDSGQSLFGQTGGLPVSGGSVGCSPDQGCTPDCSDPETPGTARSGTALLPWPDRTDQTTAG